VKALYLELGMEKVFKDYEVESYTRQVVPAVRPSAPRACGGEGCLLRRRRHCPVQQFNLVAAPVPFSCGTHFRLQQLIKDKAGDLPVGIFEDFAKKIYKRTK